MDTCHVGHVIQWTIHGDYIIHYSYYYHYYLKM